MQQKYIDCFEMFDYAEKIVALTGAGISTLSGIPDFRGKSGFYTKHTTFEGYDRDTITLSGKCLDDLSADQACRTAGEQVCIVQAIYVLILNYYSDPAEN